MGTTSSSHQSVNQIFQSVFQFLISTISKVSVRLSAVLLSRVLLSLVMKLVLYQLDLKERRFSLLNNTRKYCNLQDLVTLLVFPSKVLEKMRKWHLEILSMLRKREHSNQSRALMLLSPYRSTLVFSNLVTVLLSSVVLRRLLAK